MTGERSPPGDVKVRLVRAERELQRVFMQGASSEQRQAACAEWRAAVHAWWVIREGKQ